MEECLQVAGTKRGNTTSNRRTFLKVAGAGTGATLALPSSLLSGTSNTASDSAYPQRALRRGEHERAGIISPQKTYCMMEWEFHTPPEERFNIDIEGALHAARDAGAECMMFYTQDHWGYAYYPSDVAVRHPHLDRDLFGVETSLAHKLGMSVCTYYCLQFNNQSIIAHPDWGWTKENGELDRWMMGDRPYWYIACLDGPYRQYVLRMVDEIFSRYEVD